MGGPTACWTLNGPEWVSDAVAGSLWDALETEPVPLKYYLSPKACRGILRRAEKRGRSLPPSLRAALEQTVQRASAANPTSSWPERSAVDPVNGDGPTISTG